MTQGEKAAMLRRLHDERPLVLPNAWDAGSARVIEQAGAKAIATTSAGVAWGLGRGDGQQIDRGEMIAVVRRIARAVTVPVTADVESGYDEGTADDVITTVRMAIEAGAVGINLEDSRGAELLAPERQVERVRAARAAAKEAGVDLVINARVDVYFFGSGSAEEKLAETIRRAAQYRDAGADCVFVPGVVDAATIAQLVQRIEGPLNIMAGPGAPTVAELGKLGVARVSVGPGIAQVALEATRRAARELLERGNYWDAGAAVPYPEANGLFEQP
jgi:2-methylisocitrate lyase-like PEP mutase family enzyme